MIRKVSVSLAALAAMGLAGAASAADTVDVNINVAKVFDFAVDDPTINLELDGANVENSAAVASGISYNSNIEVDLSAEVSGAWPAATGLPGTELNFFIFGDEDDVNYVIDTAIAGNSNSPAGAAAWNINNDGDTQLISSNLGIEPIWGSHFDVVYAASAPNQMPPPDTYSLTVVYTFAES